MMTQEQTVSLVPASDLNDVIARACERIAPVWPLDRFIAVNPFWGQIHTPIAEVAEERAALSGARLLMPRAWFRAARAEGCFTTEQLARAIELCGSSRTVAELLALLDAEPAAPAVRARMTDVADSQRDLVHEVSVRDFVINDISQFCAAYFDDGQSRLRASHDGGLYARFRDKALGDRSPELLLGIAEYRASARELPGDAGALIAFALRELDVPKEQREPYLAALLLDVNGWASYCTYLRWTAQRAGGDDTSVVELLAVRLAWEWLLFRTSGRTVRARFQLAMAQWPAVDAQAEGAHDDDWVFLRAMELAYQDDVCSRLGAGLDAQPARDLDVQAVFCIDVRSEVYRRALESITKRVQTFGFAGFFGLPIAYQPLGALGATPQAPGLLAPRLMVTDTGPAPERIASRRRTLAEGSLWRALKRQPLTSFGFVEGLGLLYGAHLALDALRVPAAEVAEGAGLPHWEKDNYRPRLVGTVDGKELALEERCELAAGVLRAMGLTRRFAALVLLVGHGSTTRNNPHAAGLACGACCGQSGEVNARALAALLNDPAVRRGLAARGIWVPEQTRFCAALHDTTTDDVTLFELSSLPESHADVVERTQTLLKSASERTRRERATKLGLRARGASDQAKALRVRSRDWAEVRPEWGLANNAAFVAAQRAHVQHIDFGGRAFLHEYSHEDDADGKILALIMTAPMVVAHWINLQYYASTVDNRHYGAGNKVLHNVVGGHLGVFEGNGGDLRTGLALQSLHDGTRWMHTPLRLSVFLEAPRARIDEVLAAHPHVRALVDNDWLHLFQFSAQDRAVHALRQGTWTPVTT